MKKEHSEVLLRMVDLSEVIERLGDQTPQAVFDEYRALLQRMVAEFLPLIELLAAAGVLTVQLEEKALAEAREWARDVSPITGKLRHISFHVAQVFPNGNIWLNAGEVSSAGGDQHHSTGKN